LASEHISISLCTILYLRVFFQNPLEPLRQHSTAQATKVAKDEKWRRRYIAMAAKAGRDSEERGIKMIYKSSLKQSWIE
jgi:hypothetical protein